MATYQRVTATATLILCSLFFVSIFLISSVCADNDENIRKPVVEMGKDVPIEKVNIATSKECQEDVSKICDGLADKSNFAVMRCLSEKHVESAHAISPACQHYVWDYKFKLSTDPRIEKNAKSVCADDIQQHCTGEQGKPGHLVSCLIEKIVIGGEEKQSQCKNFLNKIITIIFEDWKFMEKYFTKCEADVKKLKCGRFPKVPGSEREEMPHSEGATIECLEHPDNRDLLSEGCKEELLKVAELQADDYHMDRPLYHACKDVRKVLCQDVQAGNGAVYTCLMQKVNDRRMPEQCRALLLRREKMIDEDMKVDEAFYQACEEDIRKYQCLKTDGADGKPHRRNILMCLEGQMKDGERLSAECEAQFNIQRDELMDNPDIDDEFSKACKPALDYCRKKTNSNEDTAMLHCLLDVLKLSKQPRNNLPFQISQECLAQAKLILEEMDIGNDIIMDKTLKKACQKDVEQFCKDEKKSDSGHLSCLMSNLESDKMNSQCKRYLFQIQYFVSRDYRLDNELREKCHVDAVKLCHAPNKWRDSPKEDSKISGAQELFVLPCLYRHRRDLHPDCRDAVKSMMHERAVSVDFMPELEGPCMNDLADKCSDKLGKGEEIQCLEDNLESLQKKCKEAIEEFIREEDEDPELDRMLMKECEGAMNKFCKNDEDGQQLEPEEIVDCMIEHKHHAKMPHKCTVQINHLELTLLKDVSFNKKFHKSCKDAISQHCSDKKSKHEALVCLSNVMRTDIVVKQASRISRECRDQLRSELYQRTKDIDLDPEMRKLCDKEINHFCTNVPHGPGETIACLKKHGKQLSKGCASLVFKREMVEAAINIVDAAIVTTCKSMINRYCKNVPKDTSIAECLREHQHEEDFDQKCFDILVQYQVNKNRDYRLNEGLRSACEDDIVQHCSELTKMQSEDEALEGKVIGCLKNLYLKKKLSDRCRARIMQIIEESALNFREDSQLVQHCHNDIVALCTDELKRSEYDEVGEPKQAGSVEDCLKLRFKDIKNQQCKKEVARLVAEGRADVHADPHLFEACQKALRTHCSGVPIGEGRVMGCLLDLYETNQLAGRCRERLRSRKEMWENAARFAPPETLDELLYSIHTSSSRFYFYAILLAVFCTFLILGVMCGRVTKRVRAEIKNR